MASYKFGVIVKEVKINIDRNNNPYEFYVAGDHMDSEDLTIHRKGIFASDDVGPAFTRLFKPGQVLYGSRRTYLKKVAVADFEGICSNTTFVLEGKAPDKFDDRLLPFIMLSDGFTQWSVSHSKGSTNPYILFSDLASYEFELPTMEKQRKLADKLWSAYHLKEAYQKLLAATDEMVKSQFLEMFGNLDKTERLSDHCQVISGKSMSVKEEESSGPISYIKVADFNLAGNDKFIATSSRYVSVESASKSKMIQKGCVVFAKNGAASLSNKKRLTAIECCIDMNTMAVKINDDSLSSEYLYFFLCSIDIKDHVRQGAIPSIDPHSVESILLPLPPMDQQKTFVTIAEQADKSKYYEINET